jgi:hypothetical protein
MLLALLKRMKSIQMLPQHRVIHKSVKYFKNSQQIDYATDHGNSYTDRERNSPSFILRISQMLSLYTFGNTADIFAIFHLVPHACRHITVGGHTCYYCILAANQGNYVRELFVLKNSKVSVCRGENYHDPLRSLFVANF